MAQSTKGASGQIPATVSTSNGVAHAAPPVNRKKQKRREKQAAKQAAEQSQPHALDAAARNGHVPQGHSTLNHSQTHHQASQPELDFGDGDLDSDELEFETEQYYMDGEGHANPSLHGSGLIDADGQPLDSSDQKASIGKKSKKKKRNKAGHPAAAWEESAGGSSSIPHLHAPPPPTHPPTLSNDALRTIKNSSKNSSIWNTSMAEERERIKEFWLSLNEKDRKSLVKIEKQTVLAKMKEQQKHSCSCTVCGRKRTAIEEELEVLYDAYYDELESYANRQQSLGPGMPILPPPSRYGHPMGHMSTADRTYHSPLSRKRLQELGEDDVESGDEEYEDDEIYSGDESEEYSDEDAEEIPRGAAADFFNFGQSLQVKGGILTVADDLLQNDGKKFIEMMEQLAERRMQREEEAQFAASGLGSSSQHPYSNHPPDEEDFEDEDEDEYDSQEDYDEEEDEMESMTEEQRMEEGRRMFQIFAARMFEQRVLTAYKEKVAKEKAEMLLQEQEEEERRAEERKAKKARDAQKKKAKKDLQKQAKAEERAKKEAEKAQEEAAVKAAEEKKQEEQRRKKEELRKKKESERKAQEEEKQRKEAERSKRQQEERERQQENERKAREQKAQDKKAKEEKQRRQREEQEMKEREARERKVREEKERKEREAKAKAEREASAAAAAAATKPTHPQPPTLQKRPSQPSAIGAAPGLRSSPQIAPALPKAPTPAGRQRQTSQPVSHDSSPGNSQAGSATIGGPPGLSSPMHAPPQATAATNQPTVMPKTILTKQNSLAGAGSHGSRAQPLSPIQPPGQDQGHGSPYGQPFPMSPFGTSQPPGLPAINQRAPMAYPQQGLHQPFPQHAASFQPMPPSGSMRGHPPGMGAPGMPPYGRGHPLETPPGLGQPIGAFPNQFPPPTSTTTAPIGPPGHSRTSSASIDKSPLDGMNAFGSGHATARPNPIGRPSSTKPHPEFERHHFHHFDESLDEMAQKMGSASLGGDEDEPLSISNPDARGTSMAPGGPPNHASGFGMAPFATAPGAHSTFASLHNLPNMGNHNWQHPPGFPPSNATTPSWGASPNPNNLWSTTGAAQGPSAPVNPAPPTPFGSLGGGGGGGGGPASTAFPPQNPRDRLRQLRISICRICRQLDHTLPPSSLSSSSAAGDGFHDIADILAGLNAGLPPPAHVAHDEVVDILDTLGDAQNGGGSFHTRQEGDRLLVRYENDQLGGLPLLGGAGGAGGIAGVGLAGVGAGPPGGGGAAAAPPGGPLAGLGPIASPVQQAPGLAGGGRPFAPIGSHGF
ncbi:MAG: hypothetical protein Q9165_003015 [Trypethelium subeluteriae]